MLACIGDEDAVHEVKRRAIDAGFRVLRDEHRLFAAERDARIFELRGGAFHARDDRARCAFDGDSIFVRIEPCGGRAIFATELRGAWVASTSLSFLVALSDGSRALDITWLATRMFAEPARAMSTPYLGVIALPANHETRLRPGRSASATRLPAPKVTVTTQEDVIDATNRVLTQGASLARKHAVLTGGVDSCAVVALLAEKTEVLPICIDYRGVAEDRPYVEKLAKYIHRPFALIDANNVASEIPRDLTCDGAPMLWPTLPHVHACATRAKSEGIDTIWTGLGGDELFEGSSRSAGSLARDGKWREGIALARSISPENKALSVIVNVGWSLARRAIPDAIIGLRGVVPHALPVWARPCLRAVEAERAARAAQVRPPWEVSPETRVERAFDWDHYNAIAFDRHSFESEKSVMAIDPFLAPQIVAAVMALPDHELVRGGIHRRPLRDMIAGKAPDHVTWRKTKAFVEAGCLAMWRAVPRERWQSLATPWALADLGLVDPALFRADFDAFDANPLSDATGWMRLFPALACEAFVRGIARAPDRFTGGAS